jgi:hypothetical protein
VITVREIQLTVATNFRVDIVEFISDARHRDVAHPRQIAMLLAREFTKHSLPRLGKYFGRDHSTVLHGIRVAKRRLSDDPELARKVESIRWVLRENYMKNRVLMLDFMDLAYPRFPQTPHPKTLAQHPARATVIA